MAEDSFYRLPKNISEDIAEFESEFEKFIAGEVDPVQFKASRVTRGIYEQRIAGKFMARIRLPGGGVTPIQLKKIAELGKKLGSGELHITDRQDIQIHSIDLENVPSVMRELASVGLSPKGGGGNTVRNIMACWGSGVCKNEAFDVAPYAVGLTEYMIEEPGSFRLPRKYKIAFSGCRKDCALATINDIGFVAKTKKENGREIKGFTVYVAGGMGSAPRPSDLLVDFILPEEVPYYAEAMKRLFDKHGNRKDKHKARLRFVMRRFGYEKFKSIFEEELAKLKAAEEIKLSIRELPRLRNFASSAAAETPADMERWVEWKKRHVTAQGEDGFFMAEIPVKLGVISAQALDTLASIIENYGEGSLRVMQNQNMLLRWISEGELPGLYNKLAEAGFVSDNSRVLANLVSCPGVSTCQLGICLSRGLSKEIIKSLSDEKSQKALKNINIRISGCPNSCGQHPIGQIGLFGTAKKADLDNLAPFYKVLLGGRVREGKTALGKEIGTLHAKYVPEVIRKFIDFCAEERRGDESYFDFLDRCGNDKMLGFIKEKAHVPSFKEEASFYSDWGSTEKFSLKGRGAGECSAGVFDMIEVDMLKTEEAIILAEKTGTGEAAGFFKALYTATKHGANCLLITQGLAPKSDAQIFEFFIKHFIDAGYVDKSVKELFDISEENTQAKPEKYLALAKKLLESIRKLHDSMDNSLRFNV